MTGDELKAIRLRMGVGVVTFGRMMGYEGNGNTVSKRIRQFEAGRRPVPNYVAYLAAQFDRRQEVRR